MSYPGGFSINLLNTLNSPRTMEILKELEKGPKSRKELRVKLGVSSSALVQTLSRMSFAGLVLDGEVVEITTKGLLVLRANDVVKRYERFLNAFGDFVNEYILEDIPENFVMRFYELDEIEVVEREEDTFKPHDEFIEAVLKAREIYGYSTIFFPEYVDMFLKLAEEGKKIEIIVNDNVFERIVRNHRKELIKGISFSNSNLYLSKKNFRFCLLVTDSYFSISFYLKNGLFDYRRDFVCRSKSARIWGKDLYEYVKSHSVTVRRDNIDSLIERAN